MMGLPNAVCLAFSTSKTFALHKAALLQSHPLTFGIPRYSHNISQRRTFILYASSSSNKTKPPPLPTIDDPYLLLGLDSRNPTTDKKEIKSAYRKRALRYHPDVILNPDSTEDEREEASKNFARINAAYEMLTGGGKGSVGSTGTAGDGSKSSSSGGYNYQPPHRRTSDYNSSSSSSKYGKSTNWEDFMPNYNEEDAKYDADGDSFGAIFSDILTGAAGYAAGYGGGGGGIMNDFIEFLEQNIPSTESGYNDDRLLSYGSFDEVASEMDETDILVTSLETKLDTVANELMQAQADMNVATKFSEKLDLEERIAELKAREKVVKGYLKKGKKRLIKLRERYKELMVEGRGGRGYQGGSSRSTDSSGSSSRRTSEPTAYAPPSSPPSTATPPTSSPSAPSSSSSANSWRNEGFSGSYGRRSSSSRRSSTRRSRGTTIDENDSSFKKEEEKQSNQQQQQRANENTYSSRASSANSSRTSSSKSTPQQYEPWVPPHRRTTSSAERAAQDKKRLRELKVDDDFERLKREMGM